MALILPFALLVIGGILYTNYVQQQADQRWCALIGTMDAAYQSTPPQTDLGRQIAAAVHQLVQDFGC